MPEKKQFNFKLGSDPEFSFVKQDKRVNAKELLSLKIKEGQLKMSDNEMGFKCAGGEIGWDGCSATAELRPKPESDVEKIVKNIRNILEETVKNVQGFELSTLSTHAPVGGHIHFQIPEDVANSQTKQQILHKKVSSFFLPIMMSENKINLRLRMGSGSYGALTDFKGDNRFAKNDNTYDYTYEFRTPSAEWLCTEKICKATFAYLGTVYNEIVNNPKNFKKHMDVVYKNNEQAKSLHHLIITDYIGITESLFNRIKKAIKTFEFYQTYKEEIDYILNPLKVINDKKKANYEIIKGWELKTEKTKEPTKKELLNEKKFQERAKAINLDTTSQIVQIAYNDDINVNEFAKYLSDRITVFNWTVKKKYFLFGMKRGLEKPLVFNQKQEIFKGKELIKTVSDMEAMTDITKRISSKLSGSVEKKLDINTGALIDQDIIIIGLPYLLRMKRNFKEFINLIYEMEKSQVKPVLLQTLNLKEIVDDRNELEENRGDFYKYVTGVKNEKEENIPFDQSSQGARIADENTRILLHQMQQDQIINEN